MIAATPEPSRVLASMVCIPWSMRRLDGRPDQLARRDDHPMHIVGWSAFQHGMRPVAVASILPRARRPHPALHASGEPCFMSGQVHTVHRPR